MSVRLVLLSRKLPFLIAGPTPQADRLLAEVPNVLSALKATWQYTCRSGLSWVEMQKIVILIRSIISLYEI